MTVVSLLSCESPLRLNKALLSLKKLGPCARTRTRTAQVMQKASLSLTQCLLMCTIRAPPMQKHSTHLYHQFPLNHCSILLLSLRQRCSTHTYTLRPRNSNPKSSMKRLMAKSLLVKCNSICVRLKLAFCTTCVVRVLVLAQGPSFRRLRRALLRRRGDSQDKRNATITSGGVETIRRSCSTSTEENEVVQER